MRPVVADAEVKDWQLLGDLLDGGLAGVVHPPGLVELPWRQRSGSADDTGGGQALQVLDDHPWTTRCWLRSRGPQLWLDLRLEDLT